MFFSKKFSIILKDDFNFANLQRKFSFKLKKNQLTGYDLIHDISFEAEKPSFVQLFSGQLNGKLQTFQSLISPVHFHVGLNGLSLSKVLSLPQEIAEPFLERLGLNFGIPIKILPNNLWATEIDLSKVGISSNPRSVYSYLHQNINNIHDDQFLNEIQMFIHQDPIFEFSKQYSGESINSLWFWGGNNHQSKDSKPSKIKKIKFKPRFKKTYSSDPYLAALSNCFAIENVTEINNAIDSNQFKSDNLMVCAKEHIDLIEALLDQYKKNITLYYRNNKIQVS